MEPKTITVQDIHNDFNGYPTHLSRMLQEMDLDLEKDSRNYDKIKRLGKLGFVKLIEDVKDPVQQFQYSKEEHDRISELYFEYRNRYKFISKRGIEHLCKKYNLFHGRIQNFITGIPEKNINEILETENETFGYSPILTAYFNGKALCFSRYTIEDFSRDKIMFDDIPLRDLFHFTITIKDEMGNEVASIEKMNRFPSHGGIQVRDPRMYMSSMSSETRNRLDAEEHARNERMQEEMLKNYRETVYTTLDDIMKKSLKEIEDTCYSIVANHSDFSVLESADTKTIELEIPDMAYPDPIVFKKTRYRDIYAIVTAWDKEASDPLVVNQSFN